VAGEEECSTFKSKHHEGPGDDLRPTNQEGAVVVVGQERPAQQAGVGGGTARH
jgi:hypothetical protein